ncbi:MAG TPA: O-antigen ligase family protein [Solirubrobacteraceae bacterium]
MTLLASVHGLGEAAEKLGVIAVALLTAVFVLGRAPYVSQRLRAWAVLLTLMATPVLLIIDIWETSQLRHLRHHPLIAAGAAVFGLALVLALALAVTRRPQAFPLLAVLALPFRLPISTGESSSNLLIPLYVVIAAGALAYLAPRLAGTPREEPPAVATERRSWLATLCSPTGLAWALMASVVLYGLQASYSADFSKALENMVFFYVPFALLFGLLAQVRWTRELLLACLGVAVALAVIFAGVGFIEYYRKALFLNPKVVAANQYDNYFRVNSLFFDPSIYGRFLALVTLALTTIVLWANRRREVLIGAALLAWLMAGLITSFSQSSIAALLLGLAMLAAWRWDVRATIYTSLAVVAVAAVAVAVAPPSLHLGLSGKSGSASNATNGRTKLISGGLSLFADRPLQGFGPGSFAQEYRSHRHASSDNATSASHTIPITVAAEQGLLGLIVYVALLMAAFGVLFSGAGRSPPRLALATCFGALVLHTFIYADFLEDPITWTLLGIGTALALRGAEPARGTERPQHDPVALLSEV